MDCVVRHQWFTIGQSHESDRLPRPYASKHVIRKETSLQDGREAILIKDYEAHK